MNVKQHETILNSFSLLLPVVFVVMILIYKFIEYNLILSDTII